MSSQLPDYLSAKPDFFSTNTGHSTVLALSHTLSPSPTSFFLKIAYRSRKPTDCTDAAEDPEKPDAPIEPGDVNQTDDTDGPGNPIVLWHTFLNRFYDKILTLFTVHNVGTFYNSHFCNWQHFDTKVTETLSHVWKRAR